jgi:hypothetical protein
LIFSHPQLPSQLSIEPASASFDPQLLRISGFIFYKPSSRSYLSINRVSHICSPFDDRSFHRNLPPCPLASIIYRSTCASQPQDFRGNAPSRRTIYATTQILSSTSDIQKSWNIRTLYELVLAIYIVVVRANSCALVYRSSTVANLNALLKPYLLFCQYAFRDFAPSHTSTEIWSGYIVLSERTMQAR